MQADIRPTVLAPESTTLAISYRRLQRHRRLFIAGVIGIGEQLIAGVVDTGDEHKFVKNWRGPSSILRGPGETDSRKKPEVENLLLDSI